MVQYCWCQYCQYWATANFCLLSLPRLVCPASPVSLFVPQLSLKAHKQASLISPITECRSIFKICHSTGSRLQDISLFPSFETKTKQPLRELQKSHEKTRAPLTTNSDFLVDTCSLVVAEKIFGSKITKNHHEKSFGNEMQSGREKICFVCCILRRLPRVTVL